MPKPVVAMVAGYAVGGGHILHMLCDLTIAADNAKFGQTGPKVGSFDGGWGASYMARIIGQKRAREVWFLCRMYDAKTALSWGLINTVVPYAKLEEETVNWCREMLEKSPLSLRLLKGALNADCDGQAGLQQFYAIHEVPPDVHVPVDIDPVDRDAIEGWLSERAGRRVRVFQPKRGDRRGLIDLASRNAGLAYESRYNENTRVFDGALEELQRVLDLPNLPHRVECFDISTIQGRETVGSMVVCENGRMQRSQYRKFRIKGLGGNPRRRRETSTNLESSTAELPVANDFAAIEEVVLRRYRRLLEAGGPFPDLVVVDGGRGQLTAAYRAFEQLGLANLTAVGIAKREEKLFTRNGLQPLLLSHDSSALHLIQRARDEAHRFAVAFHRRARTIRDFRSELDLIPGIGAKRRRALLERFGSLAKIRRASYEEFRPVIGPKLANVLIAHFSKLATQR